MLLLDHRLYVILVVCHILLQLAVELGNELTPGSLLVGELKARIYPVRVLAEALVAVVRVVQDQKGEHWEQEHQIVVELISAEVPNVPRQLIVLAYALEVKLRQVYVMRCFYVIHVDRRQADLCLEAHIPERDHSLLVNHKQQSAFRRQIENH